MHFLYFYGPNDLKKDNPKTNIYVFMCVNSTHFIFPIIYILTYIYVGKTSLNVTGAEVLLNQLDSKCAISPPGPGIVKKMFLLVFWYKYLLTYNSFRPTNTLKCAIGP